MIYFTADTHFYHTNIIKHCNRPFKDVGEMNEALIANWNSVVGKDDEVYVLGDFAMKASSAEIKQTLKKLNGKKHLIIGNHDKCIMTVGWDSVQTELTLKIDKDIIVCYHFPMQDWNRRYHGSYHLFGHIHNNPLPKKIPRMYNVGVDVNDFKPISWEQIKKKMVVK